MLQELKEKQNTVCLSRPRTILFCFPLRTEQAESQVASGESRRTGPESKTEEKQKRRGWTRRKEEGLRRQKELSC